MRDQGDDRPDRVADHPGRSEVLTVAGDLAQELPTAAHDEVAAAQPQDLLQLAIDRMGFVEEVAAA